MNEQANVLKGGQSFPAIAAASEVQAPIDLAHVAGFSLGPLHIDPSSRLVRHADGRSEILEPKAMKVLVALSRARGEILSRDDLISSCWRGRIVGDNAITRVISQLRKLQGGIASEAFTIETITKVGYRLIAADSEEVATGQNGLRAKLRSVPFLAMFALTALAIVALGWLAMAPLSSAGPVRIAVLPFHHPEDGAESADILVDELNRRLSQSEGFEVIGRVSSTAVSNRNLSAREIGEKLDVAFIVEGSVAKDDDSIAVDLAIVDSRTESTLWSATMTGSEQDYRSLGTQVYLGIVENLRPGFSPNRHVTPQDVGPATYRSYLRARKLIRDAKPDGLLVARQILYDVTSSEPRFAGAWAELSRIEVILLLGPAGLDLRSAEPKDFSAALEHSERAIQLAPEMSEAHAAKALVSIALFDQRNRQSDLEAAKQASKRAIEYDKGNAETWLIRAAPLIREGRTEETLSALLEAFKLDPFWIRSRAAGEMAWALGRKQLATDIMGKIANDHPDPSERKVALASLALWEGSIAEYVTLTREAAELNSSERYLLYMIYGDKALSRLGYIAPDRVSIPPYERLRYVHDPEFQQHRLIDWPTTNARDVWDPSVGHQVAFQLAKQGRSDEIVEVWDKFYGAEIDEFHRQHGFSRHAFTQFAPWLALSLRRAGRNLEADRILVVAASQLEKWSKAGPLQSDRIMQHARILAMAGEKDRAADTLKAAVERGWPNLLPTQRYAETADPPLLEDPTFSAISTRSDFRSIAARIEATKQRERSKLENSLKELLRRIP
ncbi:winged helix-turn-helix domain-containing protein [Altererythrobacter sp. MF3-039]|uniref:winged helix-turn-helix domain-containing protein n=1 Tax=Altererythrobacter sp. MF3-039 TaxID=3252901 RepID=UPI00390C5A8B